MRVMLGQAWSPARLQAGDAALAAAPLQQRNFAKTSADGQKRACVVSGIALVLHRFITDWVLAEEFPTKDLADLRAHLLF